MDAQHLTCTEPKLQLPFNGNPALLQKITFAYSITMPAAASTLKSLAPQTHDQLSI